MSSAVASREVSKRPLSPFAVPECGACMGERLHTDAEWEHHPFAGHGFTKEQGWTHSDLVPPKVSVCQHHPGGSVKLCRICLPGILSTYLHPRVVTALTPSNVILKSQQPPPEAK